jgi:splicing factor 3B subunit 3
MVSVSRCFTRGVSGFLPEPHASFDTHAPTWHRYMDAGRFMLAPLSYEALEGAASFSSEQCPEGLVAIAGNSLRIVSVERLGETFNQTSCKLRYTPRKLCSVTHDGMQALVVVQVSPPSYSH